VPPVPMVKLSADAAVLIVTVAPSAIVTLSPPDGITPPTHVAVALQLPVVALDVILAPLMLSTEESRVAAVAATSTILLKDGYLIVVFTCCVLRRYKIQAHPGERRIPQLCPLDCRGNSPR
jgi:hypothetical protein